MKNISRVKLPQIYSRRLGNQKSLLWNQSSTRYLLVQHNSRGCGRCYHTISIYSFLWRLLWPAGLDCNCGRRCLTWSLFAAFSAHSLTGAFHGLCQLWENNSLITHSSLKNSYYFESKGTRMQLSIKIIYIMFLNINFKEI